MSNKCKILYVDTFEHLGDEFIVSRFEDSDIVGVSIIYGSKAEIELYNMDTTKSDETREEQLQIYRALVEFMCGNRPVKSGSQDKLIQKVINEIIADRENEALYSCRAIEKE
jgi:hypothetical protein